MPTLKCPKCGQPLVYWGATGALLKCPKCLFGWGTEELWQELIKTKDQIWLLQKVFEKLYMSDVITEKQLEKIKQEILDEGVNNDK